MMLIMRSLWLVLLYVASAASASSEDVELKIGKIGSKLHVSEKHNNINDNHSSSWDYDVHSPKGPLIWHKEHVTCKGPFQSPINLQVDPSSFYKSCDESVDLSLRHYDMPVYGKLVNSGTQLRFVPSNNYLKLSASFLQGEYVLDSVRFHWGNNSQEGGSEHAVNGRRMAVEIQFWHKPDSIEQKKRGDLPTVALTLLFKLSLLDNQNLQPILSILPYVHSSGSSHDVKPPIVLRKVLPRSQAFFMYRGSSTTPPCKENVIWIVYNEQATVSEKQLLAFRSLYRDSPDLVNNFRPIQPINGRKIYQSCLSEADQVQKSTANGQTGSEEAVLNDQPRSPSAREASKITKAFSSNSVASQKNNGLTGSVARPEIGKQEMSGRNSYSNSSPNRYSFSWWLAFICALIISGIWTGDRRRG